MEVTGIEKETRKTETRKQKQEKQEKQENHKIDWFFLLLFIGTLIYSFNLSLYTNHDPSLSY